MSSQYVRLGNTFTLIVGINHDVNGNPRYIVPFRLIHSNYDKAYELAKSIGGSKFKSKRCPGYFVFTSYNIEQDLKSISTLEKERD